MFTLDQCSSALGHHIWLEYSHHPSPLVKMAGVDGNCNPTTSEDSRLKNTALDYPTKWAYIKESVSIIPKRKKGGSASRYSSDFQGYIYSTMKAQWYN